MTTTETRLLVGVGASTIGKYPGRSSWTPPDIGVYFTVRNGSFSLRIATLRSGEQVPVPMKLRRYQGRKR
jgi:hypothetical protein